MFKRTWIAASYSGISYKPVFRGYYLEDHTLDYDYSLYWHPRDRKKWYAQKEVDAVRAWADVSMRNETTNYHKGLAPNGEGPFERDLKRKGISIEKYPLPSTLATRRVHEMVILRRKQIEEKSQELLNNARDKLKQASPSNWFDEADGPLNPQFLRYAQSSYSEQVNDLPNTPLRYKQLPHTSEQ